MLPGDGIGPEITKVTLELLKLAGQKEDVSFKFKEHLIGGAAIDETGVPLPDDTLEASKKSDAVLLAAIGGYEYTHKLCPRRKVYSYKELLFILSN